MDLDADICYRAIESRDHRFDGRFFTAVVTTGVYCRPVCPAPTPKRRNVRFFSCAAAAAEAGFRPCMRCRPEASPGTPAWAGTSSTVARALRLIEDGGLDDGRVDDFAERLGVGPRHLRRLFIEHLGASPSAVAQTRRVHLAKRLLDGSTLSVTDIAFASGFQSVRRFNDAMRETFGRTPTQIRSESRRPAGSDRRGVLDLRLAYRPPFDYASLLDFIRPRAIPGIEHVEGETYMRVVRIGGVTGIIEVAPIPRRYELSVQLSAGLGMHAAAIVERVRRLFDLKADPDAIASHLARDPVLAALVRRYPGLRIPGAWDPFETSIRAILGQQVTVKAATTICGRLVARYGERLPEIMRPELTSIFPTPTRLVRARLAGLGIPTSRTKAIRCMAAAFQAGLFQTSFGLESTVEKLTAVDGIGPWTAQYIAMRVCGEPDAFPSGDLALRRAAAGADPDLAPPASLVARAERWRPWRAYATMYLWRAYADHMLETQGGNHENERGIHVDG